MWSCVILVHHVLRFSRANRCDDAVGRGTRSGERASSSWSCPRRDLKRRGPYNNTPRPHPARQVRVGRHAVPAGAPPVSHHPAVQVPRPCAAGEEVRGGERPGVQVDRLLGDHSGQHQPGERCSLSLSLSLSLSNLLSLFVLAPSIFCLHTRRKEPCLQASAAHAGPRGGNRQGREREALPGPDRTASTHALHSRAGIPSPYAPHRSPLFSTH